MPAAECNSREWITQLRRKLLAWYRRHQRDLPWRQTRDPYAIWVSEIMLQQTQVATVIPYYQRFLAALPDITALAAADEQQVLRLWEGLGYYRRARNLHRAAQQIVAEHGGVFPNDIDLVRKLPGIGRYTAGAILSIAGDARYPILEANTIRLYSRLLAYREDPRASAGQQHLWAAAENWLPRQKSGEFNQALMELGSLVCTPVEPDCPSCPLLSLCEARRLGLVAEIPLAAKKQTFESVREAAVVVRRRGRVLLLRNGDDGRWAGLWDFPRFAISNARGGKLADEIVAQVAARTGVEIALPEKLTTLRHGVTRFRITLECFAADWLAGPRACPVKGTLKWVDPQRFDEFPLSVTGRKLSKLV